jgi:hypothetical protein
MSVLSLLQHIMICWNLIKGLLVPFISPEFYNQTDRGGLSSWYSSQKVSSLSPGHAYSATCNFSAYKRICGRARVAQTRGGGALAGTQ